MTQLWRFGADLPQQLKQGVATIGNFDGIHLGHQALLNRVRSIAQAEERPSILISFEPYPNEFFMQTGQYPARLMRLREKYCALKQLGIDHLLILPFNQKLAALPAAQFVQDVLVQGLQLKHLVIGDDFRFGCKRQGDFALLTQMGQQAGFAVEAAERVLYAGERVSSTRIREALAAGDHLLADALLGRPYSMRGKVRAGDKLGRKLGFPTANIHLQRKLAPVSGIYFVQVLGLADWPLPGAANVGIRPTVDGTRALLEVHLLDFNQDIYGKEVEVIFCHKVRPEERYDSLALLQAQIAVDVAMARDYFSKQGMLP